MSDMTRTIGPPCHHARPQADSQLHGICVFCYRQRLHEARAALAEAVELLKLLQYEYELDHNHKPACIDCKYGEEGGHHDDDCRLAAFLKKHTPAQPAGANEETPD